MVKTLEKSKIKSNPSKYYRSLFESVNNGDLQSNHTPFEVVKEMCSKLEIKDTDKILVLYNVEFATYLISEMGVKQSQIIIYNNSKIKSQLLEMAGYTVIYQESFNKNKSITDMKFDVVIGNPPYQNPNSKTHKLWVDFLLNSKELSTGYIAFVTPSLLFLGHSNRITNLKESIIDNTVYINFNINQYFPGVGEDICSYIIDKNKDVDHIETILRSGNVFNQIPSNTVISKKEDLLINSILHKVKNSTHKRLDLKSDISVADGYNTVKNLMESNKISKDKTNEYNNEFIHSGKQRYYCNFNSKFGNGYKVIINFSSSYSKMFITKGVVGKQVESILVDTIEDGNNLIKTLNSKLFRFYVNISKTGGFNSRIYTLPFLGFSYYTDEQLYKEFNLTQEEIDYIENAVK